MSGIFGSVALDGTVPSKADMDAMAKVLATRGPDGTHHWRQGNVALGHTLLATTPEALVEVLPLTEPESGCTITADVRLDNREELISELGLENIGRIIGDGELILRAYLRWGEDCPTRLLGDFAFAIWDPREERLFCARDHMGMRQLIYHHQPGKLFVFATEAGAVLAHSLVPREINEGRIADFLDGMEGIDFTSTFFEGVTRLPPAQSVTVGSRGLTLRRYWQLRLPQELKLDSDEDYDRAFLEVFTEAVRCRLRSPDPIGATLSGGIDSGSIAAIAARLLAEDGRERLLTFSARGPDPQTCVETRHVVEAMENPAFRAVSVDHSMLDDQRDELMEMFRAEDDPFDCYMTMLRALYLLANRHRVNVMLDGGSADIVLSGGNRIAQTLRKGNLIRGIREAKIQTGYYTKSGSLRILLAATWAEFLPDAVRQWKRAITHFLGDKRALAGNSYLSSSFARKIDLPARRSMFRRLNPNSRPSSREYRLKNMKHPHNVAARERYDRVAAAMGIEPRDPFMDRRLIDFCLSLPASQLHSAEWPKLVLRRAMETLVPEMIRWRISKEHVGFEFSARMAAELDGHLSLFHLRQLREYVSPAQLSGDGLTAAMDTDAFVELFGLAYWLERSREKPVRHSIGDL